MLLVCLFFWASLFVLFTLCVWALIGLPVNGVQPSYPIGPTAGNQYGFSVGP